MSQKAAIRRRKQARNAYAHLAPMARPVYHKIDKSKAATKLAKMLAKAQRIQQGKRKGK